VAAVTFYISGHGLGHASRQVEIVNALTDLRPDASVRIRSSAPAWFFERTLRSRVDLAAIECDTGVVQVGSLEQDPAATLGQAARFHQAIDALADREARALAQDSALVVGDIPPLAFAAAARAACPAVAIANFTWDWIYEEYVEAAPEHAELPAALRETYRSALAAWRLPMAGGFEGFGNVVDLPWVARRSRRDPAEVRSRLRIPPDRPAVLVYLGGYGLDGFTLAHHAAAPYTIVAAERSGVAPSEAGPHLRYVTEAALSGEELRYEDLVRAVDVVLTKPGYGVIAECVANSTALLYTDRGRFREYDVLVEAIPRVLRSAYVDHETVFSRRWDEPITSVLALPAPIDRPLTNGAEVAAGMISTFL
jgi:hypothetical protein